MKKIITAILFLIYCTSLISAEIIINEVVPHDNSTLGADWVEIYNNESANFSAINWVLSDNSGSGNDTISFNISGLSFGLIVDNDVEFNGSTGCNAINNLLNSSNIT